MDLHDYIRAIRRSWILVLAITLAGIIAGGTAAMVVRPTYAAETELFVAIQNSGSVQELQQGNSFSQARVQSYVKTVESPIVLQPAIDALGLNITPKELATRVAATSDLNTVLINISVTDASPVQAAALAEAIAASLVRAVDSLEKPKTGGVSPVSLSVITPATVPLMPSAPNSRLNLMLGLLSGLGLGVGAAFLKSRLDNRIRGEDDLRLVTEAPLLGGIVFDHDASSRPLLTQALPQSPRAESFRQLRTNLQFANVSGQAKTVLVTSSLPGEGKSTTATNLAMSLAETGQKVCLVDADLRRPMIDDYLGLDRNAGLTTALLGVADAEELLQPWGDDNLFVLTSGQIPPNPSELLGSDDMKELILRLEEAFDTVIIDTPPVLPVTDAAVLAQHAGGVVVVVGVDSTRRSELERSMASLDLVAANVMGVVLNRLPAKGSDAYSYSYAYGDNFGSDGASRKGKPQDGATFIRTQGMSAIEKIGDRTSTGYPSEGAQGPNPPQTFPRERMRRVSRQ